MTDVEEICKKADELHFSRKYNEAYELLAEHKNSENADLLWRVARASILFSKAQQDKAIKKAKIYEALEIADRALKLDDSNPNIHKWYAFSIKYIGEYEGMKKQIQDSYKIREHLDKGAQLNPADPTIQHALGVFAFTFADMGWVTRKLAETIFDKPPTATYEEAIAYFEKAEELDAKFYSTNLLMAGKTHYALGNKDKAIPYLMDARDWQPKTIADDFEAADEATKLLAKLGVKN